MFWNLDLRTERLMISSLVQLIQLADTDYVVLDSLTSCLIDHDASSICCRQPGHHSWSRYEEQRFSGNGPTCFQGSWCFFVPSCLWYLFRSTNHEDTLDTDTSLRLTGPRANRKMKLLV